VKEHGPFPIDKNTIVIVVERHIAVDLLQSVQVRLSLALRVPEKAAGKSSRFASHYGLHSTYTRGLTTDHHTTIIFEYGQLGDP